MPTMLSVHEAKTNFSGVLAEVEKTLSSVTIMRYGHPIARIVPIIPARNMAPLPSFAGKTKMRGNWFEDDPSEWESA